MHNPLTKKQSPKGFSLLELSIVIVVIGLIAGALTAGSSLVESSKITALASEKGRIMSATKMFQDKYYSMPGDFKQAAGLWGELGSSGCTTFAFSGLVDGTCSGDGNGKLSANEEFAFWHHLALAGFLDLPYSGSHTGVATSFNPSSNVPQAEWQEDAGWRMHYIGNMASNSVYFDANYGHVLELNNRITGAAGYGVMSPGQQIALDKKFDDSEPDTGNIVTIKSQSYSNCSSGTSPNFGYNTSLEEKHCAPIWKTGL